MVERLDHAGIEEAIGALERIVSRVEKIDSELERVSAITDDQTETADETVAIVDVVRDIGDGNQKLIEQTRSLGDDQLRTAENVTTEATGLSEELSHLSTLLEEWETERARGSLREGRSQTKGDGKSSASPPSE